MLIPITHGSVFKDIVLAAYNKCTVLDKRKMIRKINKKTVIKEQHRGIFKEHSFRKWNVCSN